MSETFIEVRNLTKTYTKAGQVIEVVKTRAQTRKPALPVIHILQSLKGRTYQVFNV